MEGQERVQGNQWEDHCNKQCNIMGIAVEMLKTVRCKLQFEDSGVQP